MEAFQIRSIPRKSESSKKSFVIAACAVGLLIAIGIFSLQSGAKNELETTVFRSAPISRMTLRTQPKLAASKSRSVSVCAEQDDENREAYKSVLKEYVKDGISSESISAWKNDINEMLFRLEPLNPTEEPAYSGFLKGTWEFKYAGSMTQGVLPSPTREIALLLYAGGYTPGRFTLDVASRLPKNVVDVKSITLDIGSESPSGKVTTKFGFAGEREVDVVLSTNLEPESDITMSETYQSLSIMGRDIKLPEQLQSKRKFYIRYLDEDLLVVRDDTGVADILMKVEAEPETAPPTAEPVEPPVEPPTEPETPVVVEPETDA